MSGPSDVLGFLQEIQPFILDMCKTVSDMRARLATERCRHEVRCLVLKELVRARYDAGLHTTDIVLKNVAVAKAYADAMCPRTPEGT